MHKTFKQLKLTFPLISLLVLLCISFILLVAQIAFAQDVAQDAESSEVRSAPPSVGERAALMEERGENLADYQKERGAEFMTYYADRVAELEVHRAEAEARRAEFVAKMEERKAEIEAKRTEMLARGEEHRAALREQAQQRITTMAERATERLTTIIDEFDATADRMRERAEDLEADGVDISEVVSSIDSADRILTQARNALDSIDVDVEYAVTSEEPSADWADARAQLVEIRDLIKEAQELLREAVATMKSAAEEAGVSGMSDTVRPDTEAREDTNTTAE